LSDNRGLLAQLYLLPAIVRVTGYCNKCLVRVIGPSCWGLRRANIPG